MYNFPVVLLVASLGLLAKPTRTVNPAYMLPSAERKYSRAHSLGSNYNFDPRDGWQNVSVTNMPYKYRRADSSGEEKRSAGSSKGSKSSKTSNGISIEGVASDVLEGLKGTGDPENVTITWYTGQDLDNPSCWKQNVWTPTDASFACALTLDGWSNRPACFQFLELCSTTQKCVFVRVIDTCAGCAKGSKHVDLTKAAFGALADFDEGVLSVQLRIATEPSNWYENLWGPQIKN